MNFMSRRVHGNVVDRNVTTGYKLVMAVNLCELFSNVEILLNHTHKLLINHIYSYYSWIQAMVGFQMIVAYSVDII